MKPKQIKDYVLTNNNGRKVKITTMFGGHNTLVVLHNMGEHCPNCALWGDEFNGMLKHLEKVTGFVVISPDDPKTQKAYATKRGWKVKLYSAAGTSFIKDMGFQSKDGIAMPGISILEKSRDGKMTVRKQCGLDSDGHAASVLDVFWMLPGMDTEKIAF